MASLLLAILYLTTFLVLSYVAVFLLSNRPRPPAPSEGKYKTNDGKGAVHTLPPHITCSTPSPASKTIDVTVVVPSYNETARLGNMLEESVAYLETNHRGKYEIIIVDDGSTDGTGDFALEEASRLGLPPSVLKVVQLRKNRGKGGAVTYGVLHGSGKYILFADADGATQFSDMRKLLAYLKSQPGPAVAVGSRAHMVNTDVLVQRSLLRNFMMYLFRALVYTVGIRGVKDTQCGFKMFSREAAIKIFPHMHTERWIFDVELLILAEAQGILVEEVPVNWQEVGGSKVDLARDSIHMAKDLVVMRMAYALGIYKLDECGRKPQRLYSSEMLDSNI